MLIVRFGFTGQEHPTIRYNAPWLLILFALSDGALDADHLLRVLNGNGDGAINWKPDTEKLPVCPGVDPQGNLTSEPMSERVFNKIFKKLFAMDYRSALATIHAIRRGVINKVDGTLICVKSRAFLT